ncbi:STAS domain-containing protein [Gammaproteobacteria bacterium LSUCC0112]|nr:STAS domain-containing protein [Gammaproteobacteria bacterium LSUCC0112]
MALSSVEEILTKFQIENEDLERIRRVAPLLKNELAQHVDSFYVWLRNHKEFKVYFGSNPNRLERVRKLQIDHWETFLEAQIDEEWFESRRHVGAVHAYIDLPNEIYFAGMSMSGKSLVERLRHHKSSIEQAEETADSIIKLIFLDSYVVVEEITRIQREKISSSARAMMEMSTPVTPIWDGILLLPLLGILDSARTQDVMDKTLHKISETRAKVFVMDISGVSVMDTAVANQLIKITKATQLMGCETIISGLSPSVAKTLVELGVNIGEVKTTATLRDSFELALRAVGIDPAQIVDRRRA